MPKGKSAKALAKRKQQAKGGCRPAEEKKAAEEKKQSGKGAAKGSRGKGSKRGAAAAGEEKTAKGSSVLALSSSISSALVNRPAETLSLPEQRFLNDYVSLAAPPRHHVHRYGSKSKGGKAAATTPEKDVAEVARRGIDIIEKFNMLVLHNVLSPEELQIIHSEYEQMLDLKGDAAIGEKDSSKRSGTRFYNCVCQRGPACGFDGWKEGSEGTRGILQPGGRSASPGAAGPLSVWQRIVREFGLYHIARVEVVTSHRGCRHQGWHVDADRGITVIFPLVDVDLAKGPTQMDFTVAHNGVREGSSKVKKRPAEAPESCHAAMPAGGVLLFNANVSHRGTANLSMGSRPILVLDCSPCCEHQPKSLWDL